jgi:hypothetical protein
MSNPPKHQPTEASPLSREEPISPDHPLRDLHLRLVPACMDTTDTVCTLHKNIWTEPITKNVRWLRHRKETADN